MNENQQKDNSMKMLRTMSKPDTEGLSTCTSTSETQCHTVRESRTSTPDSCKTPVEGDASSASEHSRITRSRASSVGLFLVLGSSSEASCTMRMWLSIVVIEYRGGCLRPNDANVCHICGSSEGLLVALSRMASMHREGSSSATRL